MGGGVSKRVVPTFTVSIVFNNDPVTIIDVAETATLSEARKEVEKAAEEFKELPQHGKFYFLSRYKIQAAVHAPRPFSVCGVAY